MNPQGRRRPLMRKRPQTPEERYAPVQDESSYSISTRVRWKPSWSVIDSSLVSSGAATIRGRRGLEELRDGCARGNRYETRRPPMKEKSKRTSWSRPPKVAQHLMHLRAQAKELDIQAQVDAWHARSPNKRLIGTGLFDVDVLGQNCFGLQEQPPVEVYDMAPAPALAPAPAPRKRMFSMQKGRTRFSTPEHVWKKKDWAEQELAFKRRVGITIGPRAGRLMCLGLHHGSPLEAGRSRTSWTSSPSRSRWRRPRRQDGP